MSIIFIGLLAASLYGAGDFFGGLATRRLPLALVVCLSHLAALTLLSLTATTVAHGAATPTDLAWGLAGGILTVSGMAFLYQALAVGQMSVVAPTTAVLAIAVPVLFSLAVGPQPGHLALIGIVLAAAAVVLIGQDQAQTSPGDGLKPGTWQALAMAGAAGLSFGLFFIILKQPPESAGLWPLVAARCLAVVLTVGAAPFLLRGYTMSLFNDRRGLALALLAGIGDAGATGLYVIGLRYGDMALMATLTSLYPASTIVLARVVLKERFGRLQSLGLVCGGLAVILIAQS